MRTFAVLIALLPTAVAQDQSAARIPTSDGLDAGSGTLVPIRVDDSVPLPIAPVIRAGLRGDRVLAQASGDPDFLSFCGGPYFPPAGERIDPLLSSRVRSTYDDGRPRQETYAFVMFSKRITPQRVAELEAVGARVIGSHPYYALKVALAPSAFESVAALDFVRWIGLPRDVQKVHPILARQARSEPIEFLRAYVDVFDSDLGPESVSTPLGTAHARLEGLDLPAPASSAHTLAWRSNGWQQRALEDLGLEVVQFLPGPRAFEVRLNPAVLELVAQRDFVQFVEPVLIGQAAHDESMPMIQADFTRSQYSGGTNGAAVAGVCDTGFDFHNALGGAWWGIDYTGTNVWQDGYGHGTHVAGTMLGNGSVNPSWAGVSPGLGGSQTLCVIAAKIMGTGGAIPPGLTTGQILAEMALPHDFGNGNITPKPHVVNHSWGGCTQVPCGAAPYWGSELDARDVDDAVYGNDQLHVFAAGNEGPGGSSVRVQGSAKNAFTVGAVVDFADAVGDPGTLAVFSSRGPCSDGRWKPNVVAPGQWIWSAMPGTANGYVGYQGTSMATPHVTGLAAQLCDHYAFLRYQPARLASLLMATAMTKDDGALTSPADPDLNRYGAGRIEAYKAQFVTQQWTWGNFGFNQGWSGYTFGDFPVPAGTTRLVVCLHYDEPSQSAGGTPALVNNLDLWIDDPSNGISPGGNTGDYFAQQSALDNTEIRSIDNPSAGTWRFKAYPTSFGLFASVKASVTYCCILGDTKPDGELSLVAGSCVQPNQALDITATVSNPSYVASAVFLDSTVTDEPAPLVSSTTTLKDGAPTNFPNLAPTFSPPPSVTLLNPSNLHRGYDLLLGDIAGGEQRSARWTARWATEGIKQWQVQARSDNWVWKTKTVNITVDGTGPAAATNLNSPTHQVNVWSNDPNVTVQWTPAVDNLSGLFGYGVLIDSAPSLPPQAINLSNPAQTSYSFTLPTGSWFFNLRAIDNCGNWSTSFANLGRFKIDLLAPQGPGALWSPTHTVGVQSCDTTVTVEWSAASDADSGLQAYVCAWDTSPSTDLGGAPNLDGAQTSYTLHIGSSNQARYFHIRALDWAGNWGTTQHFGPIYAHADPVNVYCTAKTNSAGCLPSISSSNAPSLSGGEFQVDCVNVLGNKNGLLYWGLAPASAPFQGGIKCVAAPTQRTDLQSSGGGSGCTGHYTFEFSATYLGHQNVSAGDTLYCQWWMRDPASPSTTGLSNALKFTLCE